GRRRLPTIAGFRIVREIGQGGMGIVYEAIELALGRRAALKVLLAQRAPTTTVERFHREARAAAKLHHTNIVPVFGVGQEGGLHYYVMQFIPGLGLDEVLVELEPGSVMAVETGEREMSSSCVARSLLTGQFAPVATLGDAPMDSATGPA